LAESGRYLSRFAKGGRITVVTDDVVWEAQGARLTAGLAQEGIRPLMVMVGQGEAAKSWAGLETLVEALLAMELGRSDYLVALGGGVVGDLAGFAAAILKRGCGLIQIPTTLLAQVDSSVGGKTAINARSGKNMVGAFHQPSLVLIDPDVLDTLPLRQVRAGYAETVKYALLGDPDFFRWCEHRGPDLLKGEPAARHHAIATSVASKARIVVLDERETGGARALLNLGHTFGHALEAHTGFSGDLLHGEAVGIGMLLAYRYSVRLGLCPQDDADRVARHLRTIGLPTIFEADPAALVRHMRHDKKAKDGRAPFVLVRKIGDAFLAEDVDLADVEIFLQRERSLALGQGSRL
jgi:3-dehydroquinate synthase